MKLSSNLLKFTAVFVLLCLVVTMPISASAASVYNGPVQVVGGKSLNVEGITGDDVVAAARKYIGKPYNNSANKRLGPDSFDCSGLVYRVYSDVGVTGFTSNTLKQKNYGVDISSAVAAAKEGDYSLLEVGDILFFDYNNDNATDHVALYSGNGNVIEALSKGVNEKELTYPLNQVSKVWKTHLDFLYAGIRLLNVHEHTYSWENEICTDCGEAFTPDVTQMNGTAKTIVSTTLREKPYSAAKVLKKLPAGTTVNVLERRTNIYNNTWYKVEVSEKYLIFLTRTYTGYVYASKMEVNATPAVNISVVFPSEGEAVARRSQPLLGEISAPSGSVVSMYIDNVWYAEDTISNGVYVFRSSHLDYNCPFNKLSIGQHDLKFVVVNPDGGTVEYTRHFSITTP